jgi:hypothetical protein
MGWGFKEPHAFVAPFFSFPALPNFSSLQVSKPEHARHAAPTLHFSKRSSMTSSDC